MSTMSKFAAKTVVVTGANSGLGFEAAAQFAEAGWGNVVLACRSQEKADNARTQLKERVGSDPFDTLVIDTSEFDKGLAAADDLNARGIRVDYLLLNAGAMMKEENFNSAGVELTYAAILLGHHALTMRSLELGVLTDDARIVIAGSEAARGGLPGIQVHDIRALADAHSAGDISATIQSLMKLELGEQEPFVNAGEAATAKLVVAWWAASLARRVPDSMAVYAVSPGAALGTNFSRDAPAAMRMVMIPMMKLLGPLMGVNGPVSDGAKRYVDAFEFPAENTGAFYATAHRKKFVGPLGVQTWPSYFEDEEGQEAAFQALTEITGVGYPEAAS